MAGSFHIENFGCRAARADGEAVGDRLCTAGHCAQTLSEAEVVIVNTCSVTAEADRAARAYIRRTRRLNPTARIVVTGCYAQRAPEELAAIEGVSAVVGNSHKALTPEIAAGMMTPLHGANFVPVAALRAGANAAEQNSSQGLKPDLSLEPVAARLKSCPDTSFPSTKVFPQPLMSSPDTSCLPTESHADSFGVLAESRADTSCLSTESRFDTSCVSAKTIPQPSGPLILADENFAHSFLAEAQLRPGQQTRPNLKIQEGCGNHCSFCVIPLTRGPSRSLPFAAVLKQVEGFVAAGGRELVVSGINLGRWGRDLDAGGPRTLAGLVRALLERTELARLRLSSIEPMDWDEELIGLMAEFGGRRLARHAHLPLQSGSDAVLRRMYRRYRPWHYAQKVESLRKAAGPELTLGADVMAGFPGESDAEFEETLAFLRALPVGYLHLFPFSPRPSTPGWALHAAAPVSSNVVEERMQALRALGQEKMAEHRAQFVGRRLKAITLHTPLAIAARGGTEALTDNFLPVELEAQREANELIQVRVTELDAELKLLAETADD
jgi:threonylcarbamoyladenosine tRNA methylthiotransferase MtaB